MENNRAQIARELWKRINKRVEEILDYKNNPGEDKLKKVSKNLTHTKNYFNENSIEFSEEFREKFRKLYYRGFQAGLSSNITLTEMYLLKDQLEKEVEKTIKEGNITASHTSLKITEPAQNNTFINSVIHGGVKIDGSGNKFISSYINPFKQKHPFWFFISALGTILGVITGLMYLAQYTGIIPDSIKPNINTTSVLSTTTPNVSSLLAKALSYDTVAERQDFLGKYVNSPIYGDGTIKEISRSGERFLLDITASDQLLICPQEKTDDLEKQFYFLKGRSIRFYGIFTYSTYFGSNGLVIDNCSIEIK